MPGGPRSRSQRRTVALALVLVLPLLAGCASGPAPAEHPDSDETNGSSLSDGAPGHAWSAPAADPARLMELVRAQTHPNGTEGDVRYRVPGTPGHASTVPDLAQMLRQANATVQLERFQADLPRLGQVNLTNVYGVREGADPDAGEIWLAAHWDSRAWADAHREACTGPPVQGANDGAAAVAVVVHALELLGPTNHTVRVALFDAEDQGCQGSGWATGSDHAADTRAHNETIDQIRAMILVDMPGAEDLVIRREGASHQAAPRLTDRVFGVAERLDATAFLNETGPSITDDHVPFLQHGVPAVDLIHLDEDGRRGPFPWTHHTEHDTVENLDAQNLAQVSAVVAASAMSLDERPLDARG